MGIPIFRFLFRKMWNTRWMTISSLAGLIVAVAFVTSIPMYADGSLKNVVSSSLAEQNQGLPAGALLIRYQSIGSDRPDLDDLANLNQFIREDLPQQVAFPFHNYVRSYSIRSAAVTPLDPQTVDASRKRQMSLMSLSELEGNAELVQGRMYADGVVDGNVIEVVVLEESLYRNDFRIGNEFVYPLKGGQPLTLRVVGAVSPKDATSVDDVYWYQGLDGWVNSFLVSEKLFEEELLKKRKLPLDLANWYYNFDLGEVQTSQLAPLTRLLERLDIELYQRLKETRLDISFANILNEFRTQSLQMQSLLFTLAVPMIAMVFYYIIMNARQSLDRQRNDIAVLRSRGASNRQIVMIYFLESLLLGTMALVIGPMLGWFMAKSIGSSSGFLTFVDRQAIPIDLSPTTLIYGGIAVLIALIATLIPAIIFARSTIVGLKREMARGDRKPFWMKWYLDVLLIGIAAYGWYSFNQRQFLSMQTGMTSDQLQVQPLLFFVPALTIFSVGLFFLRIFPLMLKIFTYFSKRFLPVPMYLTLNQLSRSSRAYYPIMLLLILTLGLGVYNSAAARTIDLNSTERVLYNYGTDVIIEAVWEATADVMPTAPPKPGGNNGGGNQGGNSGGGNQGGNPNNPNNPGKPGNPSTPPPPKMIYSEPPFQVFRELPGVEHAARVLKTPVNATVSGKTAGRGTLFGIDNVDFAEVAWLDRKDLFPGGHPREYLNLLGYFEQAALVPQKFAERYQLKVGDVFVISIDSQPLEFVAVGILPYWPSMYPDESPFFVVNIDYIYDQVPMMPYEVWLKMEDGAKVLPVVEALEKADIQLAAVPKDVRNELVRQARHPARGGVFGILSLGFLVSIMISLFGYILYWFFNLSSRVVQFGVLRAMGLSRKQLTGMLLMEQGATAGLSIGLGIIIGRLTSYLFLPFLQTAESAQLQVPPFRIVFEQRDTYQLYLVVLVMMTIGAGLLFMHIRRLKVHQAVKLGEER